MQLTLPTTTATTALLPGSLILVTGANGYIATHIVNQLLIAGYHVRGTVRDATKAAQTTTLFTGRYGTGKFAAVVVPDMSVDGAFDDAVKGTLSPFFPHFMAFEPPPNPLQTSTGSSTPPPS